MKENDGTYEMPMSMVMAMAESSAAMTAFSKLSDDQRAQIIERAREARCPADMKNIIAGLTEDKKEIHTYGVRGLR